MRRRITQHLVMAVPVLGVVSFLSFYLINLLPGDAVTAICGGACSAGGEAKLRAHLGLDQGILTRYLHFLSGALHGNLGYAYSNGQPVSQALAEHLPVTIELMIISQVIALAIAIPLAMKSASNVGGLADRVASAVSFGMLSIPVFMIGVILMWVFSVILKVFPATGFTHISDSPVQNLRSMVLPSVTLALGFVAVYMKVLRSELAATLGQDFIAVARAKGLSHRYIMWRHALRPSISSLITLVGVNVGSLIGGAFVVEIIFQLPGIGLLTVDSITSRDYLMVQGVVLVTTVGFVVVNVLADIVAIALDPRLRSSVDAAS